MRYINDKIDITKRADLYPKIDIDTTIKDSLRKYETDNNNKYNKLNVTLEDINKKIRDMRIQKNVTSPVINLEEIKTQMNEKDKQISELNKQVVNLKVLLNTTIKEFKRTMNTNKQEYHERTMEEIMKELQQPMTSK